MSFNKEAYQQEHISRLVNITTDAQRDGIAPYERIKQIIQLAVQRQSSFIKDGDLFVGIGHDGFEDAWFPTGSFKTKEEVLLHVKKNQEEEEARSGGGEISTTFFAFTRDRIHIGILENNSIV